MSTLLQVADEAIASSTTRPDASEYKEMDRHHVAGSNRTRILTREKSHGYCIAGDGWLYCQPYKVSNPHTDDEDCWRHTRIRWEATA